MNNIEDLLEAADNDSDVNKMLESNVHMKEYNGILHHKLTVNGSENVGSFSINNDTNETESPTVDDSTSDEGVNCQEQPNSIAIKKEAYNKDISKITMKPNQA